MLDHDAPRAGFASDHAPDDIRLWLTDLRHSLIFLTRLPVGGNIVVPPNALAASMRAFPVAGAVVGVLVGLVLVVAASFGAPAAVAALIAVAAGLCLTGALHEDGLADVADGFGGGTGIERKLEIMRDSRIGSYGVLALIIAVGLKSVTLAIMAAQSVWLAFAVTAAAAAVSRVAPAGILYLLAPARRDGVSVAAGRPGRGTVLQAAAVSVLVSIVFLWPVSLLLGVLIVPLAGLAGLVATAWIARRQIGGQTGDVAGASQVVAELAILVAAVMALAP